MNRLVGLVVIAAALALPSLPAANADDASNGAGAATVPLVRAHAHNDYQHKRPLLDALECGFCSVEADVFLVDGELLVGHSRSGLRPDRTLAALYLEPLRQRARQNGGRLYADVPTCLLFIDIKTEAESTYAVLHRLLERYADLATRFDGDSMTTNAITVIVSGHCPRAVIAAQSPRYAACDGLMPDLESGASPTLVPVISEPWTKFFQWRGNGPALPSDLTKLREFVAKARAQQRRLRFWAAPDKPEAWRVLYDAGVDLINTDNLVGARDFLRAQPR
jgi:hypothetical protein